MKKFLAFFAIFILCLLTIPLSGCTKNTTTTLAKDLDASVKNLSSAVSALDWPETSALDSLDSLDEGSASLTSINTGIDTTPLYTWLTNLKQKINIFFSKRSDLAQYISDLYSNNTSLNDENYTSMRVYINIIKDNSTYLSNYNGLVKNQINEAKTLINKKQNTNTINAYIIKAVETLQVRCAKIDTSIMSINSIIDIISNNLKVNHYTQNEHKTNQNPIKNNDQNNQIINNNDDSKKENEKINEQDNQDQTETQTQENLNQTEQNDNIDQIEESENAINFDGEISEVEMQEQKEEKQVNKLQENEPTKLETEKQTDRETNSEQNYDDQIMPLPLDEEKIIITKP